MEVKDWNHIEDLFHAALHLNVAERAEYLDRACAGDGVLRAEIESLLAAFEGQKDFMEAPAFDLGLKLLSSEAAPSLIGRLIGPYKILELLGRGGMGEVYLGEDTRLGRKIALKFLSPKLVDDNWAKRRLVKEAQAVAMLEHPNICAIYGIEEAEGHSFIIMQYVEGDTLASLIQKRRTTIQQSISYAIQIVNAVAEAHAHGIIHRDIKPQNIVVTASEQIKVLDFGLAKIIQRQQDVKGFVDETSQISQSGLVAGTVAYMSPEQLRAERPDFRSDIFSLGIVLYELISGKRPFARDSDAEVISAILTSRPPALTHNSEDVPPELARIVFKCLEKGKEHRYQSASELLYDLENFHQVPVRSAQRWQRFSGLRLAAAFALLLILVAAWSFMYRHWNRSYTLAVLPVNNESNDASLDYLEDGFAESLITKLSRLPKLRVNAFTTVSGYRGAGIEPQQIGRNLGVDSVLTGRIIRQGDSLILQTNLINTADGSEIWGERYDINEIAIPDLQENVSEKIASNLELQLGVSEKKSLTARATKNDEAFQEYLRGRFYWKNRNKDNIQKAIEKFKAAIELDPAFALAYAGLADCYVLMNTSTYGSVPTDEAMNRARAAAKQALEIDNTLPEAHTSLGVINLKYDWDWREAEKQFKQAISLNPDYAPAHYWYSNLLTITGRQAEAVAESTLDKNLDPFSPSTRVNFCREFYYGRQYDKAAVCFNEILKEDPENIIAQHALGFVYEQQAMNEEAIGIFEKLPETNKVLKIVALGYSYGRAGRKAEALRALAEAEEISKHTYIPPFEFAVIYLGLGDKEQVFVWLEKAYEDRFATLIYLTVDPAFDNIRADPRFGDLARRLNLPLAQPPA